jgi:hypothetical protein
VDLTPCMGVPRWSAESVVLSDMWLREWMEKTTLPGKGTLKPHQAHDRCYAVLW